MLKSIAAAGLTITVILLSGCVDSPGDPSDATATSSPSETSEPDEPEATSSVAAEGVLFSELLPGIAGANSVEFIELYNAGSDAVDLRGWSISYAQATGEEETLLYSWDKSADIPGHGHYLLARAGQEFGLAADAIFDIPLFERKGGLLLRDGTGKPVDALGWGEAPTDFYAGSPAPAPESGSSLERLPGGELGNGANSGDNAADMQPNNLPDPQNSGSSLTPLPDSRLEIVMEIPDSVEPGTPFDIIFTVENLTGAAVESVALSFPMVELFDADSLPEGAALQGGTATWSIQGIPTGGTATSILTLRSPNTYVDAVFAGYYAQTSGTLRAYGTPQLVTMAGGSIPIGVARELIDRVVTVEGIATFQTEGLFAGTTGTKFYMEDETGGIQVYVPEGMGIVEVGLGERVRATGVIEVYRDSLELIPVDINLDIEILGAEEELAPRAITVLANETDASVIGRLNVAEGTATRIEEFSFSYEIDLTEEGSTTLIYIDKLTGVTTEPLDLGKRYRITGISEFYNGFPRIYPRVQEDISELYPPVLLVEIAGPLNAAPGATVEYAVTTFNHTEEAMTNVEIRAQMPNIGAQIIEISGDGGVVGEELVWRLAEIGGNGESETVTFKAQISDSAVDAVGLGPVAVHADQWRESAVAPQFLTYIGSAVPIWAVQGDGARSPYVRNDATVRGIATAVFPELGGFWIQATEIDGDASTSDGLFVVTDDTEIGVAQGDLVLVSGRVREISGQTALQAAADQIIVESSGHLLPEPVAYDPPSLDDEALSYNESLEGMLVFVEGPALAVAPTTQYGESAIVLDKWHVESVRRVDQAGFLIFVDDGSAETHSDQSTLPFVIERGDTVNGVLGPLAFSFGNHKIEPIAAPAIGRSERPLPSLPSVDTNVLSVGTFNVENLFDTRDPHPSSPPQPTLREYRTKLVKLADAILRMGSPAIVGLQEVENIDVLEDLVELESLADLHYSPYLIEGTDSRGIDVGYLVRGEQISVEGIVSHVAPGGITSRPPLMISATLHLVNGDRALFVLNNHFTSLAAGEEATEPQRAAQAAWNVEIMSKIQETHGDALFVIMGDLNSFVSTLPIDTIQSAGMRHVYEYIDPADEIPYTYIFEGRTQTLDHILVSEELFGRIVMVQALHIDADYPVQELGDATARRVSDHDPLVVHFSLE